MPLFIFWIAYFLDLELNFIGKLLVFRWEQTMLLLLQICFFFVMKEISWSLSHGETRLTLVRLSIPPRYLDDDLLSIDNIYFYQMVDRIYTTELHSNKANSSDTEAPVLDLNVRICNCTVSTKIYDKRDDFDFDIVYFPFLDGCPHPPPPPTGVPHMGYTFLNLLDSSELL